MEDEIYKKAVQELNDAIDVDICRIFNEPNEEFVEYLGLLMTKIQAREIEKILSRSNKSVTGY